MESDNILEIKNLTSCFFTEQGVVPAVNGVSITVPRGKIVGIVGESGCGKSMTAKSVMGLLKYPGKVTEGEILFCGKNLLTMPEKERRALCGSEMSMIFQEPMTSLNPVLRVGRQVREALLAHHAGMEKGQAKKQVLEIFEKVGIPEPEKRYACYPHQLSGGLRQRVMIAMAMICKPKLLIADEPTTALDVTIEAQILRLMRQLRDNTGMSVVIITHNLGVVAEICDTVYVMYAGHIMEQGDTFALFDRTAHPYTKGLLASIPRIGSQPERLHTIPGSVPNLLKLPQGCAFCARCEQATGRCSREQPELYDLGGGHACRCFLQAPAQTEGENA